MLAERRHFDLYALDTLLPDGNGIDLCLRELESTIARLPAASEVFRSEQSIRTVNEGIDTLLALRREM